MKSLKKDNKIIYWKKPHIKGSHLQVVCWAFEQLFILQKVNLNKFLT